MHSHTVDTHQNQDKVLKESYDIFKGGSLAFLDEDISGEVEDILSTEITETTTKKAYADKSFRLSTGQGLHIEGEIDVSIDDIMRFASYNIDLSRKHSLPFTTVIITIKQPSVTSYTNPSITFTPKIINLKKRNADKVLAEINKKLEAGDIGSINALELIYLPLYGSPSGKTTAELLDTAIKLTPEIAKDDKNKRNKLHSLLILLTSSFITEAELSKILEANMRILEDSPAVRVLEDMGIKKGIQQGLQQGLQQGIERTALNMLKNGFDYSKIADITGLDVERIMDLEKERLSQQ